MWGHGTLPRMAKEVILWHPDNPDETRRTTVMALDRYLEAGWELVEEVAETPEDPGEPATTNEVEPDEADERNP